MIKGGLEVDLWQLRSHFVTLDLKPHVCICVYVARCAYTPARDAFPRCLETSVEECTAHREGASGAIAVGGLARVCC